MVKGEDAVAKRRNKARRKKQNNNVTTVSARVASIIAAKKRRQLGVRRKCQGMCYSLPSIDDPFNDNHGKPISNNKNKETKKNNKVNNKSNSSASKSVAENMPSSMARTENICRNNPSKFLSLCLKSLERAMQEDCTNSLFSYSWGLDLLKCYTYGRNVLETSGCRCNPKQIAWLSAIAADSLVRNEKDGGMCSHPSFLFLVPSPEVAKKVRFVCKYLKEKGFQTISIHSEASIDHQIEGLNTSEPEFIIATPERLSELIHMKAIDVSKVSFLVIDETETSPNSDFIAKVEPIKEALHSNPFTVVFSSSWHNHNYAIFDTVLSDPVSRMSSTNSTASLSAFIRQSMDTCSSEHEKMSKCIQVLRGLRKNKAILKVLCVVSKAENSRKLKKLLMANQFSVSQDEESAFDCDVNNTPLVHITKEEHVFRAQLESFEAILLVDFVDPEFIYPFIVTRMARNSRNGVLFSFLTEENCVHVKILIRALKELGHEVPHFLL